MIILLFPLLLLSILMISSLSSILLIQLLQHYTLTNSNSNQYNSIDAQINFSKTHSRPPNPQVLLTPYLMNVLTRNNNANPIVLSTFRIIPLRILTQSEPLRTLYILIWKYRKFLSKNTRPTDTRSDCLSFGSPSTLYRWVFSTCQ